VTLRRVWMCLCLIGCGSSKPAATSSPPPAVATATAPTAAPPSAATPPPEPATAPDRTLFERLGGLPAITAVVEEFVGRTTTDARIKQRFFNTDATALKRLLTEFVAQATGGQVTYTGRDMVSSHAGMDLVDDEFNALVEDLVAALDKFHVPDREKGELLGALGPLKPQIVVAPGKLKPIPDAMLAKVTAAATAVKDPAAAELLAAAVTAGKRGQRSYAEQLFSRAELIVGPATLATASEVFREGAPPRIHTALKPMKDAAPQPTAGVGRSDDDNPSKKRETGMLHGSLLLEGKPPSGLGLVMLWPKTGKVAKRAAKFRVIEQRNKTFAPHLMAVPVGSTVAFPNFDSIYHNVFSLSQPQRFDLGMYKAGDMRQMMFDKPGIIRIGCNIHANMAAYLVVVDAPHYAVADQDGGFAFRSLRPGKYRVQAWSEQSAEPMVTEVTIKAGDNQSTIDLRGGASQGPSADKFGAARAP
jgi:hemoglobin